MNVLRAVLIGWLVVVAALLSPACAQSKQASAAFDADAKFNEQWQVIQKYFVRQMPDTPEAKRDCFEKILSGGISMCLDDRHSTYFSVADMRTEQERTKGEFYGIGISLAREGGKLTVASITEGGPAALSGKLELGDVLMAIDGEDVHDKTTAYAVSKIRGAEGAEITLTFKRGGRMLDPVVLTRAKIEIPSVKTAVIDEHTTLIKVNSFGKSTYLDFAHAVNAALADRDGKIDFSRHVVVDLRGNPGGLLNTAQMMAAMFSASSRDTLLVEKRRTEERILPVGEISNARTFLFLRYFGGKFAAARIAVVVDENSASASEIFAGILQQWGVAKVVGTTTYGKGSVQITVPLDDGDGLHITIAEYFLGAQRARVNGIGITPDVAVKNAPLCGEEAKTTSGKEKPLVDLEHDAQLRAALQVLGGK